MARAQRNMKQKGIQESIALKNKRLTLTKESTQNDSGLEKKKLDRIDPFTQKLFEMLPPPKNSNSISISKALRSDIELVRLNASDEDFEGE